MSDKPRANVVDMKPVHHGGLDYASLRTNGIQPGEVTDFSVNVNPFGPPPPVQEAIASVDISHYPDTLYLGLRERIAAIHNLDPSQVLVTNGTSQAIWLLALAYLDSGDLSLIPMPSFGEYQTACSLMNSKAQHLWSRADDHFHPDAGIYSAWIRDHRPRIIWLCNPNNPCGYCLSENEIASILEVCSTYGGLLIVDEAYLNFVDAPLDLTPFLESNHLILLRSMTKDYALAGLRLGYILGMKTMISHLQLVQPPWSVNCGAQSAGITVLDQQSYYRDTWQQLRRLTDSFYLSLKRAEWIVHPTRTNFMLIRTGRGSHTRDFLWEHHLLVRDCASFGLPEYIRVAARFEEDNQRLITSLQAYRESTSSWES
jgi:histidinol-phosphate aminotransferase